TIGEIKNILELFLLDSGIKPEFFVGDYSRFYEDIIFDDGALSAFEPDVIFINTSTHNIENPPFAGESRESCSIKLENTFNRFKSVWQSAEKFKCPVIQNNFEYPPYRVMGNYDAVSPSGKIRFVNQLNEKMADYAFSHKNLYINDFNYISASYGIDKFSDPSYYNSYKYAINPEAIPYLCHSVAAIIKSLFGKNKKALMLDLDNTLWHGVIGDDGVEGIKLGTESPEGIAHTELQRYAKELSGIGVILGVCSKNEESAAKSGFDHPSSVLKVDDFLSFKANWEPKSMNLVQSAHDLNVGVDSFVFADDNPAEREIVRAANLGISVPELSAPERFALTIANGAYFEITALSADDIKRAEMYKQNLEREKLESGFTDYGAYLKSLNMRGYISAFTPGGIERIAQLANKTNQFNLTTRRYTQNELEQRAANPNAITLSGRLEDKFGDNGIVTEIVANIENTNADIELWIMSCRVFKRELEYAMFDELVRICCARGVKTITGSYFKTAKNVIVANYYGTLGFEKIEQNGDDSVWRYSIPENYENKNKSIEVYNE
ncbi:MAG: HAD-IIIC family phosphatase, partial [Oscillospiraceae bacterium]